MPGRQRKRYRVRLNDGVFRLNPKTDFHDKLRLLTPEQAGAYLGLSTVTLAKLRLWGEGPSFYKLTAGKYGRVGYRISVLDAWLETRRRQSTAEDDFLREKGKRHA